MTLSNEGYTPVALAAARRRQAIRVWAGLTVVVGLWASAIIAAPFTRASGIESVSTPLYSFFSYICHQLPDRSFHLYGYQFGVCARCFGVYLGLLLGVAIYPMWRGVDTIEPIPRFWLFLSLIPVSIDWSLTAFGIWENTHLSRFITGVLLGFACATFIVPAFVEITRNLSFRTART